MDNNLIEQNNQSIFSNEEIENIVMFIVNEIRVHKLSWDYNVENYLCNGGCYYFSKFLFSFIPNSQLVAASKNGKYDHCVIWVNDTFYDARGEMFASKYNKYVPMNSKIELYMQNEFGFIDKSKEERLHQIFLDISDDVKEYIINKLNNENRRL